MDCGDIESKDKCGAERAGWPVDCEDECEQLNC